MVLPLALIQTLPKLIFLTSTFFLRQQVNQEMLKEEKGVLTQGIGISTGGCTDCGKSLGLFICTQLRWKGLFMH
ncbi:AVB_G0025980.mRNA.1.CDS.1 [Saccharomyces cerevisiae]|nr:AVB_G0025980.mRNA.1.CDS.1 [Saccharomyces cerevisiae]CAI7087044.1 AVB_G0025980.mRNA.1.CDS.1 [Saccharomyces cerevisiae]